MDAQQPQLHEPGPEGEPVIPTTVSTTPAGSPTHRWIFRMTFRVFMDPQPDDPPVGDGLRAPPERGQDPPGVADLDVPRAEAHAAREDVFVEDVGDRQHPLQGLVSRELVRDRGVHPGVVREGDGVGPIADPLPHGRDPGAELQVAEGALLESVDGPEASPVLGDVGKPVAEDLGVGLLADLRILVGVVGDDLPARCHLPREVDLEPGARLLAGEDGRPGDVRVRDGDVRLHDVEECERRLQLTVRRLELYASLELPSLLGVEGIPLRVPAVLGGEGLAEVSEEGEDLHRPIDDPRPGRELGGFRGLLTDVALELELGPDLGVVYAPAQQEGELLGGTDELL
jgi:hypothetical protein